MRSSDSAAFDASLEDPCPSAETILEFARGELGDSARAAVERHLDRCSVCATVVADAAGLSMAGAPATDADPSPRRRPAGPPTRLAPGTAIGRYIVLSPLGAGGMGVVYAAHDRELDRTIALKIIHATLGLASGVSEGLRTHLLREARAMARLHHPNVVPIHDVGTFDGRPFLAMERIDGGTLRTWLRAEARTWREIRDVFLLAGEALAAAHEAGLVHRDFKPSNVLVDPQRQVFVADFGLAIELRPDPDHRGPALRSRGGPVSSVAGTPAYMAPEQHLGQQIDARADQFSVCTALYEALHGQLPSDPGSSRPVDEPLGIPTGACDGVPAWLDRVIGRGRSTDPEDRFASMPALLDALQHDRRRARAMRRVGVALGLLAPLIAVLVGWVLEPRPTAEQRAQLERLEAEARSQAASGRYIYPPPDDPLQPTAYSAVMEMESMDSAIDAIAEQRAHRLRLTFADDLVAQADRLWERAGGRVFAIDAYASALVFDPTQPRARERAGLTVGERVQLRQQAQSLAFTAAELEAAQTLARVRDADPPSGSLWSALVAREQPLVIAAGLAELIGEATASEPTGAAGALAPTEGGRGADARSGRGPPSRARPAPASEGSGRRPRDPAAARASIRRARAELAAAKLNAAERGFIRALAADPRAAGAHAGLAEVEFERGAYPRAIAHAERAVSLAPKSARHRVLLGDALLKVNRYREARNHYRRAASLGSATAKHRAELLDDRLGSSR